MVTCRGISSRLYALFAAAVAVIFSVLAGCTADGDGYAPVDNELSFGASVSDVISGGDTKGYVSGRALVETVNARSSAQTARNMFVTAHVFPQNGEESDYFKDTEFSRSDDGYWHHTPALYWPIGSKMDIIAYSSSKPLSGIEYNIENAATSFRTTVGNDYLQDDILFGSSWHSSQDKTPLNINMKHSQAWITFSLRRTGALVTIVDSVVIHDVFTDGLLEVTNNLGDASATWNFRSSTADDLLVPDVIGNVYGSKNRLNKDAVFLDVLLPEQEKCQISIVCTIGGRKWRRTVSLSHSRWLMGVHYTYSVDIHTEGFENAMTEGFTEEESGW